MHTGGVERGVASIKMVRFGGVARAGVVALTVSFLVSLFFRVVFFNVWGFFGVFFCGS